MKREMIIGGITMSLALCSALAGEQPLERGRNEGTMSIPASNVIGNGNITMFAGGMGSYSTLGFKSDPTVGLTLGISDLLQINARTAFTNFVGLGMSNVQVQMTLPGNDHLRFFGLALSGELFLSTMVDTIGSAAASGKPVYNSFMLPSGIIDLDWIALFKTFPLKTYLSIGLADNPDLLFLYDQISFKMGFEWKMYKQKYFRIQNHVSQI